MGIEIERKFLVLSREAPLPTKFERIDQGYFTLNDPTVRVRRRGDKGYFSIKSKILPKGTDLTGMARTIARAEYEYEIPVGEAEELLNLCAVRIEKIRYYHPVGFEHDVYFGKLAGLEIIEWESDSPESVPEAPPGIVWKEVTKDKRFTNLSLALSGRRPE